MKRSLFIDCIPLIAALWIVPASLAQDADVQEMMKAYEKASSPSEHHQLLAAFTGNFSVNGKFRWEPDGEWMTGTSTADAKWILDGRFVMQEFKGSMMPMSDRPFEGVALMGYDNAAGKYTSVWIDNHSTTTYYSVGTVDASGEVISMVGSYMDPMTHQKKDYRWVYRINDEDGFSMEMYEKTPDGTEFLSGEITYSPRSS